MKDVSQTDKIDKTGGPAFPVSSITGPNGEFVWGDNGMRLRDYFAAKALPALIQQLANTEQAEDEMRHLGLGVGEFDKLVAKCAYDYADAMLKARGK